MTSVLFDLNNLAIRTFFSKDIGSDTPHPEYQLWKYFITSSVYNSMFNIENVDEIILAVDAKTSWRKLYFQRYKEDRRGKRDKSEVDWDAFFAKFEQFQKEIKNYLPFKVIKVNHAEADDIIGIISSNNSKDYIIISNDEDYIQCLSENVKVYNPMKKEYVVYEAGPEDFIIRKSLLGQAKDCIFNIKTPLDHPKGVRKPGFGEKALEKVMSEGYEVWLEKNNLKERFEFNRNLIDFNRIPNTIRARVLNEYKSYELPDPSGFYEFFKKQGFTSFLEEFDKVETQLLKLY